MVSFQVFSAENFSPEKLEEYVNKTHYSNAGDLLSEDSYPRIIEYISKCLSETLSEEYATSTLSNEIKSCPRRCSNSQLCYMKDNRKDFIYTTTQLFYFSSSLTSLSSIYNVTIGLTIANLSRKLGKEFSASLNAIVPNIDNMGVYDSSSLLQITSFYSTEFSTTDISKSDSLVVIMSEAISTAGYLKAQSEHIKNLYRLLWVDMTSGRCNVYLNL